MKESKFRDVVIEKFFSLAYTLPDGSKKRRALKQVAYFLSYSGGAGLARSIYIVRMSGLTPRGAVYRDARAQSPWK